MRVILQRVNKASVFVDNQQFSSIEKGILILLGVEDKDGVEDINWMVKKICNLRIFNDIEGVMNKSVMDIDGEILVVSQFTLHASTKKGNRPSYIRAAKSSYAKKIYLEFISSISNFIKKETRCGSFGKDMVVKIENDGPVTITIDSKNKE